MFTKLKKLDYFESIHRSEKGKIDKSATYIVYESRFHLDNPRIKGIILGKNINKYIEKEKSKIIANWDTNNYDVRFFWVGLELCWEYREKESRGKYHLNNHILCGFEKVGFL